LLTKGTVRDARVRFEHVHLSVPRHRKLDVEEPDDAERPPEDPDDARDLLRLRKREAGRRQDAGGVAGMDARLLDVLHDRGDVRVDAVAERVHVHLDSVLDEAVDQDPVERRHLAHLVGRVADAHRAAAEDVRRADEHRVADPLGDLDRLVRRGGDPPLRRAEPVRPQPGEALAVLGEVDGVERRAEDR
jgi:hypothetical protein